ncbi:hypothetical protein I8920_15965 (plasmid) [Curtobacterium sp. YC1]|uniref:hypothetical protein n=1 Tax=Curtobacterium sp. YC1 TaxID=2795488 RepID=UPI0018E59BDA|nr:hypothetical protein [Curtobacterium sp. YC1]QQD77886.1 hypothetical protein I8920_15965 [Curtobacterium sp. YC1]
MGVVLAAGLGIGGATAANAAPTGSATPYSLDGIKVQGLPKLQSEEALLDYVATNPVQTTVSAKTGEVISVAPVGNGGMQTKISERNVCKSGDAYWAAAATPYTNNCFYGSAGTYKFPNGGTHSNKFHMGKYTARGGWKYNGKQLYTPKQGPGSVAGLDETVQVNLGQIF